MSPQHARRLDADDAVFGRIQLGYVVVESNALDAWRRFGVDGLGLHADATDDGCLAFRIDDHQRRLIVRRGPAEDVTAIGWQLDDGALEAVCRRLYARGIPYETITGPTARERGVERLARFTCPKRIDIELYTRPLLADLPLGMRASGFVTGASGMGHFAITTREPEAMLDFWQQVFGARISDHIEDRLGGVTLDFTFLRLNERHHTIAIAATRGPHMDPLRNRIHHLNLQAASLDDVTSAYLRCRDLGFAIANTIGQHPNDRELSFYVASPSGFEIELGWSPIVVGDESAWTPARYQGISLWGHVPRQLSLRHRLAQLGRGLGSLLRHEYTVPAGLAPAGLPPTAKELS